MRLLLDTHALHWWLIDSARLSMRARAAMADPENDILASAASGYELAQLIRVGRVTGDITGLQRAIRRTGFAVLALTLEQAIDAGRLPGPHRDPWDRLIIAQALSEQLTVVTADRVFRDYGVAVLW
jgi:PIN domain nuclease of toxin-antitoxin system